MNLLYLAQIYRIYLLYYHFFPLSSQELDTIVRVWYSFPRINRHPTLRERWDKLALKVYRFKSVKVKLC